MLSIFIIGQDLSSKLNVLHVKQKSTITLQQDYSDCLTVSGHFVCNKILLAGVIGIGWNKTYFSSSVLGIHLFKFCSGDSSSTQVVSKLKYYVPYNMLLDLCYLSDKTGQSCLWSNCLISCTRQKSVPYRHFDIAINGHIWCLLPNPNWFHFS